METLGIGLHFEDLPLGRQFRTVGRTVTEADIVHFCSCTGMTEVLFTDLEFLRTESDIKGRVAPGALAYTFAEGLLVHATMQPRGPCLPVTPSIIASKKPRRASATRGAASGARYVAPIFPT